jgi:hypothetical protein
MSSYIPSFSSTSAKELPVEVGTLLPFTVKLRFLGREEVDDEADADDGRDIIGGGHVVVVVYDSMGGPEGCDCEPRLEDGCDGW